MMDKETSPTISIIMAVYNGGEHLRSAIDSVLAQSFTDFELVVVNDASTDDSVAQIEGYDDPRIKLLHNEENKGLAASLNVGLKEAKGRYIARMDADDLAVPERLKKQLSFLEKHPDIGLLGSNAVAIDDVDEMIGVFQRWETDDVIRWVAMFDNPFIHSSVMFRHSLLTENSLLYDESLVASQDYDLWVKMLKVTQGANCFEPLILFRQHQKSISVTKARIQQDNRDKIAAYACKEFAGKNIDREAAGLMIPLLYRREDNIDKTQSQKAYRMALNLFRAYPRKTWRVRFEAEARLLRAALRHKQYAAVLSLPFGGGASALLLLKRLYLKFVAARVVQKRRDGA